MLSSRTRLALLAAAAALAAAPARATDEKVMLWVEKFTASRDCALHTEVTVNGRSLGTFSDTNEADATGLLKPGLNVITFSTTPHEPAGSDNHLDFALGAVATNPRTKKTTMRPVLASYRNNQDWKLNDETGAYTHPFGPNPKTPTRKTVTHTYRFTYAGVGPDVTDPKDGDYVLKAESFFDRNPSVVATVTLNGKALGSFHAKGRQLVVTDLLKPGENEVRLATESIADQLYSNETTFEILGPVAYNAPKDKFVGKPVVRFNALEGWARDKDSGVLHVKGKPGTTTYERVIRFNLDAVSK